MYDLFSHQNFLLSMMDLEINGIEKHGQRT